ncbi:MAG: archaeosortase/exosortase family protein [Verrucomicrobiota bacterium]|nr:archaeosortase/exosortase family protein [Verrucomicrobiota bacterium]
MTDPASRMADTHHEEKLPWFPYKFWLVCMGTFVALWVYLNHSKFLLQGGLIKICLGAVFAAFILLRNHPFPESRVAGWLTRILPRFLLPFSFGIVLFSALNIPSLEWLSVVGFILSGCLIFLPSALHPKLIRVAFLLWFLHPLPDFIYSPLSHNLQNLSTKGAELMLLGLGNPVVALNQMLNDGYRVFEVVEACNGMRTSIALLISVIGLSMVYKLPRLFTILMVVIGLLQALLLNMGRITVMVLTAKYFGPSINAESVHDVSGAVVVLVSVALAAFECRKLQEFAEWLKRDEENSSELISPTPVGVSLQHMVVHRLKQASIFLLVGAGGVFFFYFARNLSTSRIASRKAEVVTRLVNTGRTGDGLKTASYLIGNYQASVSVRRAYAYSLLANKKISDAMSALAQIPDNEKTVVDWLILARCLAVQGKSEEANQMLAKCDPVLLSKPEFAFYLMGLFNDLKEDEKYYTLLRNYGRLYDKEILSVIIFNLAEKDQWDLISFLLDERKFEDPRVALLVYQSHVRAGHHARAVRFLRQHYATFKDTYVLLGPLLDLIRRSDDPEWHQMLDPMVAEYLASSKSATPILRLRLADKLLGIKRFDLAHPILAHAGADQDLHGFVLFLRVRYEQGALVEQKKRSDEVKQIESINSKQAGAMKMPDFRPLPVPDWPVHDAPAATNEVIALMQKGIEAGTLDFPEFLILTELCKTTKGSAAALTLVEKGFVSYGPENENPLRSLKLKLLKEAGRWREVQELSAEAAESGGGNNLSLMMSQAAFFDKIRFHFAAMESARRACATYPDVPEARIAYGFYLLKQGRAYDALRQWDLAEKLGADTDKLNLLRIGAYAELGEVEAINKLRSKVTSAELKAALDRYFKRPAQPGSYLKAAQLPSVNSPPAFFNTLSDTLRKQADATKGYPHDLLLAQALYYSPVTQATGQWKDILSRSGTTSLEKSSALFLKGWLEGRIGQVEDADRTMLALLERDPDYYPAWEFLLALGKKPDSLASLIKSKNLPEPLPVKVALTQMMYKKANRATEGLTIVNSLIAEKDLSGIPFIELGTSAMEYGDLDVAQLCGREAVARNPNNPYSWALMCQVAFAKNQPNEALALAVQAARTVQQRSDFDAIIVKIRMAAGNYDDLLLDSLRFLEIKYPNEPKWVAYQTIARYNRNEFGLAVASFEKARKFGYNDEAFYILGTELYHKSGNFENASLLAIEGMRKFPSSSKLKLLALDSLMERPEGLQSATAIARDIESNATADPLVFYAFARLSTKLGRIDEAKAYFEKGVNATVPKTPTWYDIQLKYSQWLLDRSDFMQAKVVLDSITNDNQCPSEYFAQADLLQGKVARKIAGEKKK